MAFMDYPQILEYLSEYDSRPDHDMYRKWQGVYIGMSAHIDGAEPRYTSSRTGKQVIPPNFFGEEYQKFMEERWFSAHPREDEVIRQWRMGQYRPFQKDPFLRVIQNITGSIFQDTAYSIEFEDVDDYDYIWGNNFDGTNLIKYFSDHFKNIAEDPNSIFVRIPKEPGYATTTTSIEPEILWIPSRDIKHITDDEVIFHVGEGEDRVVWVINRVAYLRFRVDSDGTVIDIDRADGRNGGYYVHSLDRLPVDIAGGIWNTQGYYDSWLDSARAWADNFVSQMSALQLVNKEASHPFIIEASVDCPECHGHGEKQVECTDCPTGVSLQKCNKCEGKGLISRNPGDRLIAPVGEDGSIGDLIKIVNPEVAVNEYNLKNAESVFKSLEKSLSLNYIDEAQSGEAKDRDLETRYQFYSAISTDIYGRLIYNSIKDIIGLRHIVTENGISRPKQDGFTITPPSEFKIKTASILLSEYDEAKKSGVPDYVLGKQLEDYVDRIYGNNEILKKKVSVINDIDILALKSDSDKQIMVMNNAATTRDYQFSVRLPKIIDRMIREKGDIRFLDMKVYEIEAEALRMFNEMIPAAPSVILPEPGAFNDNDTA